MEKKNLFKISVLVILGMFVAISLTPLILAAPSWNSGASDNKSYYIAIDANNDDNDDQAFGVFKNGAPNSGTETELFRVQEDGKFGIGTTGPDAKLDVLDSSVQLRLTYTDGSVYTDLQTTSSGKLYINPSGNNVGIGISTPAAPLDIFSDSTQLILTRDQGNKETWFETTDDGNLYISMVGDSKVGIMEQSPASTLSVNGGVTIGANYAGSNAAPSNGMLVEGNVGIGTTNPKGALNVDNTGESKGLGVSFDTYFVQTTNANPTTLATISTEDDTAYALKVTIIAIKSDASGGGVGSEIAHYIRYLTYRNDGGTLNERNENSGLTVEDDGNWDIDIDPSGTNIEIEVTGTGTDTIEWQATVQMHIIGV